MTDLIEKIITIQILINDCGYSQVEAEVCYLECEGMEEFESQINDTKDIVIALRKAGYAIVPQEPTRAMWAAGGDSVVQHGVGSIHHDEVIKRVWYPMLKAAEAP